MKAKLILPAPDEARGSLRGTIKYSLFPPLGLTLLAAYLRDDDSVTIEDDHTQTIHLDDTPDLVGIEVYVSASGRAYQLADHYRRRGVHVVLGGLHATTCREEAAQHADTIITGPAEEAWPRFLSDFRAGRPARLYSSEHRDLRTVPRPRRDLIARSRYLVPNTIVVSRGCPHRCDFCYQESFFGRERSFYTAPVDRALAEIADLPGRHLYFLDDHLFGDREFATALFAGMRGMHRLWQAAGTVRTVLKDDTLEKAVACGLRSLFVGFETLSQDALSAQGKRHNLGHDYCEAVRKLHDLGIMINGSFVFGFDQDGPEVFERTVDWALRQGLETATFHILTPYPGTRLTARLQAEGRILTEDWARYNTRHAVFRPARMSSEQLEQGYRHAYRQFYSWRGIVKSAATKAGMTAKLRHLGYTCGWKKSESLWKWIIRSRALGLARPILEAVLAVGNPRHESAQSVPRLVLASPGNAG